MPEEPTGNLWLLLTFLPMALGSSMMILLFVTPGSGGATTWIAGGLMVVTTMSMMVGQMGRTTSSGKRRTKGERRDYLRYLTPDPKQGQAADGRAAQGAGLAAPRPASLWSVAMSARLWERRPAHRDFAEVRIGTGPQLFAVRINPIQTKPVEDLEPLCARALRRFISAHATVADQPVAVFLRGFAQIVLSRRRRTRPGPRPARWSPSCSPSTRPTTSASRPAAPRTAPPTGSGSSGCRTPSTTPRPTRPGRSGRCARRSDEVTALFGQEFAERPRHEPGAAPEPRRALRRRHPRRRRRRRARPVRRRRVPQRGPDRRRRDAYRGGTPSGRCAWTSRRTSLEMVQAQPVGQGGPHPAGPRRRAERRARAGLRPDRLAVPARRHHRRSPSRWPPTST